MIEGRTEIQRAFLSGTSRHVRGRIIDWDTKVGFQPGTLTLSIYDITPQGVWACCVVPYTVSCPQNPQATAVTSTIVNGKNDADISAFVDASGYVDFTLTPADTTIAVPGSLTAKPYQRLLLLTWTWASPAEIQKHEIVLSIAPDRETVAT